jgi:Tfp pilus assembly protein PilN
MIEINLLPSAAERRQPGAPSGAGPLAALLPRPGDGRRYGALAVVGLGVVLAAGWALWNAGAQAERLQADIAAEAADSARYAETIALWEALRASEDSLRQRIEVIRSVDTRRFVWPRVLEEVSRAVPAYTWLHSLTAAERPDSFGGPGFTLQGTTASTHALTLFMKHLEASPWVDGVTLVSTEQVEMDGHGALQRFTLEASYRSPAHDALAPVAGVPAEPETAAGGW